MPEELIINRFWSKVKKTNYCWNWEGAKGDHGYGRFNFNGRLVMPHRFAYELINGQIPSEFDIDHTCQNKACVNPSHLEVVTHKENCLRGKAISKMKDEIRLNDKQKTNPIDYRMLHFELLELNKHT